MSDKVIAIVSQKIIDVITSNLKNGIGAAPWNKPWNSRNGGPAMNGKSKKLYRGINALTLPLYGFSSPFWFSKKQVLELGGRIKLEEFKKSAPIIFSMWGEKVNPDTGRKERKWFGYRFYQAWNYEQCEGLPARFAPVEEGEGLAFQPIERAEGIVSGWAGMPTVKHEGGQALYRPSSDCIMMPAKETFKGEGQYYSTLFHEMIHSTGHSSRLARPEMGACTFGSHGYSKEELTAEMGAAILCAMAGIENTLENSISYLQGWLSKLQSNPDWLIKAAAQAQKAVDLILGRSYEVETVAEGEDSGEG